MLGCQWVEWLSGALLEGEARTLLWVVVALHLAFFVRPSRGPLSRRLIVSLHWLVYDVCVWVFFPVNWLINAACALQPQRNRWDSGVPATSKSAADVGRRLLAGETVFGDEELLNLFDSLPRADTASLLGATFDGRVLRTNGSVLDLAQLLLAGPLSLLGLRWGKRYRERHVGDPLFANWLDWLFFPLPVWGNVSMIGTEWRGATGAAMIYDHQPWIDYFAVVRGGDKALLLGVWTARDRVGGWFTLERRPELSDAAAAEPSPRGRSKSPRGRKRR